MGHQLAGLTRQLERVLDVAADDSSSARDLLTDANQRLVALTEQVRGLAHRLFPPELELLGLAGALRERTQIALAYFLHYHTQVSPRDMAN